MSITDDVERWLEALYAFATDPESVRRRGVMHVGGITSTWKFDQEHDISSATQIRLDLEDRLLPRVERGMPDLAPLLETARDALMALCDAIKCSKHRAMETATFDCREAYRRCVAQLHDQSAPVPEHSHSTGAPGRPSSANLVWPEFRRRMRSGEVLNQIGKEATYLADWLKQTYPGAHPMTEKTIRNTIREEFNTYHVGLKPR